MRAQARQNKLRNGLASKRILQNPFLTLRWICISSMADRSGSLAAGCLIPFFAGESALQHAVQRYCEASEQRLALVFRASSILRRMLVLPKVVRIPLLFLLTKAPSIARYMVRKTR